MNPVKQINNIYAYVRVSTVEQAKNGISLETQKILINEFVNSKPNLHVYDLVYNPIETKLLKDAKDNNKTCQNGLDMLVYQAAESFKIWHGIYPNINNDLFSILRRDK